MTGGELMKTLGDGGDRSWIVFAAINFALLAACLGFGFVAFFASLEIVLTLGAPAILAAMGETVRANYALGTLRNVWLLVGGILLLVVMIYSINIYFKQWRVARAQRAYVVILAD